MLGFKRSDIETRFIYSTYIKPDKSGLPNLGWQQLKWSLNSLALGVFPSHSPDGRAYVQGDWQFPLARTHLAVSENGFYSAVVLFVKGDMDFFCQEVGLGHYNKAEVT